ncbi:MAG: sensor histidine kinase [Bacteroidetes bacterium]|nr:sensor histidine kinase [Bacteroidota bacterium]
MKFEDPKSLASTNAALTVLFFSLIYSILGFSFGGFNFLILIIIDAALFIFLYFLIRYTADKFIYDKIKIIYKSIHNLKVVESGKGKIRIARKSIDNVNQEVIEWGEQQRKEIMQLKQLANYRREFLGNISHELKTPIFNIQGYVLTLLDGGLDDPRINKEYLLRTEKSINRMIAIVEDLEAISQLESGELKLEVSKFNIVALTREIIEFLEIKAKKRDIKIKLDRNYEKPIFISADKKRIRQVLINLIDNSIKYGRDHDGKTVISFFDMDEHVLVEVTDNGIGIDKENIPRIFERFYRTDKGRSREQGGTGLGLAIVKHIIEAHNEAINVRSSLGIGTTFGFTLKKA